MLKFLKPLTLVLLIVCLYSCTTDAPQLALSDGLYISNSTIVSANAESSDLQTYLGHVVIENEEIVYVGLEAPNIKGNYETIDGSGSYLIPGLIDSHVHLTEVQGMTFHHMEKYPDLVDQFFKQLPRSYLYHGFTTLINLGGISPDRLEHFNNQPVNPDLYHTGWSGASVANGYPMNYADEDIRWDFNPNFIYLESEAERIPARFDPKDHTPKAVAERIKASGAIAVKSYYESGFGRASNLPLPTKEIMQDLQRSATENGLVLVVHGNSLTAHSFLSEVGVDIIAHGIWNWGDYNNVAADSLPDEIKAILDLQIKKHIGYMPTLTVLEGERVLVDPEFLENPALKKVLSVELVEWYKSEEGQWFANDLFSEMPVEEVDAIYGRIQAHSELALKYLAENGGNILFGTDTPSGPIYGNPPGLNGYVELKMMYEAGVPLDMILQSATVNNSQAFGLYDIGTIEIGKRANLLLLSKNPLKEIEAYDNINTVIVGGKAIDRSSFSANRKE